MRKDSLYIDIYEDGHATRLLVITTGDDHPVYVHSYRGRRMQTEDGAIWLDRSDRGLFKDMHALINGADPRKWDGNELRDYLRNGGIPILAGIEDTLKKVGIFMSQNEISQLDLTKDPA